MKYVKRLKIGEGPKRQRIQPSRFESTPHWREMKKALAAGIGESEYIQIQLTPEEQAEYKLKHRRTIARFLKKYVQDNSLRYSVNSFNNGGDVYFRILNDVPIVKVKSKRA